MVQYNEALLLAALGGIEEALLETQGRAVPEEAVLGLLGPPVLGLLRANAKISAPIRSRALNLLLHIIVRFPHPSLCGAPGQVQIRGGFPIL